MYKVLFVFKKKHFHDIKSQLGDIFLHKDCS